MKLYSNYHLYKLPYYYLETIRQIDFCRDGVVLLDEFWKICDARLSRKASNRVVADILARSRKRQLIYIFTAQVLDSVDKRIKKVTDFCLPPYQKIICNPSLKEISQIQIGENVLAHTGNFEKVKDIMQRDFDGDMYEITPDQIRFPIKMTEGHPILVAEPIFRKKYQVNYMVSNEMYEYITNNFFTEKVRDQAKYLNVNEMKLHGKRRRLRKKLKFEIKWKKPEELKKNDLIAFPIMKEIKDVEEIKMSDYSPDSKRWKLHDDFWRYSGRNELKIKDTIKIDNNFMKFMGYYVGDGGIHKGEVSIAIDNTKKIHEHKIKEVESLFKDVFGVSPNIKTKNHGVEKLITFGCIPLSNLFEKLCGKGCENKRVPQWVLTLSIEKQKAFLEGYLASDGHKLKSCGEHKFSSHSFVTISEILIKQLTQIVLRIGYKICVKKEKNYESNNAYKNRMQAYSGYISKQHGNSFIHDGYYLMPIREIKKEHYSGIVYNLEIENANSYTTSGICVHNCSYPLEIGQFQNTIKVLIFRTAVFKNSNFMKQFYYNRRIPESCYDSYEEIDTIDDTGDENPVQPPKLMWQEGTSRCNKCKFVMTQTDKECPQCQGTEFTPIEPMFFDDWVTADTFATAYWEKLLNKEQIVDTEDDGI